MQGRIGGVNVAAALEKALQKEKDESFTKVYLAKRGEGDPKGWYASQDGKTERERKEGVEGGLERACVSPSPTSTSSDGSLQVQRRRAKASLGPDGAHELLPQTPRRRPLRRPHPSCSTFDRPRTLPRRHSPFRSRRPLARHHLPPRSPPSERRPHPGCSSTKTLSNAIPLFFNDERPSERGGFSRFERTSESGGIDRFEGGGFSVFGRI